MSPDLHTENDLHLKKFQSEFNLRNVHYIHNSAVQNTSVTALLLLTCIATILDCKFLSKLEALFEGEVQLRIPAVNWECSISFRECRDCVHNNERLDLLTQPSVLQ